MHPRTALFLVWVFSLASASADLRLPALFSEHMVLQAGAPLAVWGWSSPDSAIKVAFIDAAGMERATGSATTNPAGRWSLQLPALPTGLAGRLAVSSDREKKNVTDVLVGEVWLGGGQSNMSYRVASSNVSAQTLAEAKAQAAASRPAIRFFMTANRGADEPQDDVQGKWNIAEPETVGSCSAVSWYFGLALHEKLHTPVGLIVSAVGGTPAQTWIPKKEFDTLSVAAPIWQRHREALAAASEEALKKFKVAQAAWLAANPTAELKLQNAKARPGKEPYSPTNNYIPNRLYNGMIAGLEPYTVKGIIWFQADGNSIHPEEYSELIQGLIKAWRAHWHAELPFYYVEMNNMHELQKSPEDDRPLSNIREAQNGALLQPRTGVVSAIDLGIAENAHFPIKKPVGDRLANLALTEVYGFSLGEVQSPTFESFHLEGDQVRIHLKHAAGLRVRDGAVRGFALQDKAGHWSWAEGKLDGAELVLWNPQDPHPQALRYAWAENPIISIENGAGLPLRPFRVNLAKP